MKKIYHLCMLLMFALVAVSCAIENPIVDPNKPANAFEVPQLSATKSEIQSAFIKSDVKKIESLISPTYLSIYKSVIESNPSKLAEFGTLLKSMKLISGDSIGAVYQVNYKNVNYEVTFSKEFDGTWKLVNF